MTRDRRWDFLVAPAPTGRGRGVRGDHGYPIEFQEALAALDGDDGPWCCLGMAEDGPLRCTCWEEVYDVDQAPASDDPTIGLAPAGGCHDCAYRPHSPERAGDPDYAADATDLDRIVVGGAPFTCHQGIRRLVGYRHPDGRYIPITVEGAYRPPQTADTGPRGRPWPLRADGTHADLCAGWAARRWALVARDR